MATPTAVRAGLAAALRHVPKLTVEENLAEITTLGEGGAVVIGGPTADLTAAQGRGNTIWNYPLYCLASSANYGAATAVLDELVNPYGDRSILECIWNRGRAVVGGLGILDSAGQPNVDAHVDSLTAYGVEFPNAGVPHLAAILNCVVLTPGRPT
jgi:hypothetical protein